MPTDEAERRSSGGILIPATAQQQKRLVWGEVVGAGPNVRSAEEGDQVLFSPDDRFEVEVHGDDFLILRERDVHAIAAPRVEPGSTGLYWVRGGWEETTLFEGWNKSGFYWPNSN